MLRIVLIFIFGDWNQSEKLSDIKPSFGNGNAPLESISPYCVLRSTTLLMGLECCFNDQIILPQPSQP